MLYLHPASLSYIGVGPTMNQLVGSTGYNDWFIGTS